jgi:hypothetical protein
MPDEVAQIIWLPDGDHCKEDTFSSRSIGISATRSSSETGGSGEFAFPLDDENERFSGSFQTAA